MLCISILGCWLWSYVPQNLHVVSHHGHVLLVSLKISDEQFQSYTGQRQMLVNMSQYGNVYEHFLGFAHVSGTYGVLGGYQILAIPYWFLVILTGIGPILVLRSRRRMGQRKLGGKCPGCGYDLRGTPDRCPECGWNAGSIPAVRPDSEAAPLGSRTP